MRSLVKLLKEVHSKPFDPDLTRSGMLRRELEGKAADSDSQSSGQTDNEEDKQQDAEERDVEKVVGIWEPDMELDDEPRFARHKVSRFVHLISDEAGATLKCGRKLSQRIEALESRPRFMHPLCSGCFATG